MGEIVRLIILDLLQQELLFLGHRDTYADYKTPLYNRGGFYTKFVSTVETDEGNRTLLARSRRPGRPFQASSLRTPVECWKTSAFGIQPTMIAPLFSTFAGKCPNERLV